MHVHFSKNKKPSQCSPKASHSGKNHQKSFHPSKSLQTPPNLSKPSKSPKIFPHLTKNFPKTPKPLPQPPQNHPPNPPEHPQTSHHPPQTHQNTSQILRNHPVRQISGQNLTPLSANSNTTFWKSGTSRAPVGHQSGTSREPVGNQSGTSRENPCTAPKGTKMVVFAGFWHFFGRFLALFAGFFPKTAQTCEKTCIFNIFHAFGGGARIFPTGSRLVPDGFPTGSRFAKSGADLRKFRCQISRFWVSKKCAVSG